MKKTFLPLVICLLLLMILVVPVIAASTSQEVAPTVEVTPILLGGIAGVVLSLSFSFIPGLNIKYASLAPEVKRLIMLVLLVLTSLTLFGLSCEGVIDTGLACNRAGVMELVALFFGALMTNQPTYNLTPLPWAVKLAAAKAREKSLRDAVILVP